MWYGLTEAELARRCEGMGLAYRFRYTLDPKTAASPAYKAWVQAVDAGALPAGELPAGALSEVGLPAGLVSPPGEAKAIRAEEEDGVMVFLLGVFAPPLSEDVPLHADGGH